MPKILQSFDRIQNKNVQDFLHQSKDVDSDSSGNHSAGDEATRIGEMHEDTEEHDLESIVSMHEEEDSISHRSLQMKESSKDTQQEKARSVALNSKKPSKLEVNTLKKKSKPQHKEFFETVEEMKVSDADPNAPEEVGFSIQDSKEDIGNLTRKASSETIYKKDLLKMSRHKLKEKEKETKEEMKKVDITENT